MPLKIYDEEKGGPLQDVKHIVGIAAGKGGVGKSTVAVQLAIALQRLGYSVGLMDTDIYGPSIRKMLPEDSLPSQKGQTLYPAISQGIKVISMAYFRKESEAAAVRAPIANSIVTQFVRQVAWGKLDYLLIDFPPGTGDVQLTLSQQANLSGAIMVTTPQEVAVIDVRKAMHLFDQVGVPVIGIVENMSHYYHEATRETLYLLGKGGGRALANEAGVPLLGEVPIDPSLSQHSDQRRSLSPTSRTASAFTAIAQQAIDHLAVMKDHSSDCLQNFELIWKEIPSP